MAKLFMTIGLPASGKSTYCSERICKDTVYLSSDVLREKLLGDVNDQSKNDFIFNEMFKRTVSALKEGKNVYYDATNLNRKKRVNFLKQLPECEKICLMFCTPFCLCCERNNKRTRIVPKEAMKRMYKSFQPPHRAEGFDMIVYISNLEEKRENLSDLMRKNIETPHDNPYHKLSCGEHCLKVEQEIQKIMLCEDISQEDRFYLSLAAKYHDLSKFKCKTFKNFNGQYTSTAHYYGHEKVSAYDWLSHSEIYNEKTELVTNLIENHMILYSDEKLKNWTRSFYGEQFWKYLKILHSADIAAI